MDNFSTIMCVIFSSTLVSVNAGCASAVGARMCHATTAMPGTSVTIDTTGARATDNTTLTPLCVCRATIRNAKLFSVKITGPSGICGSIVKIQSNDTATPIDIQSGEECSSTVKAYQSVDGATSLSLDVDIMKIQKPFDVDYCIELSIPQCGKDEYQCLEGTCIPDTQRCDYDPNCPTYDDDEQDCDNRICAEGTTPCKDKSRCYSKDDVCNNVTDCDDGSDEHNCGNSVDVTGVMTTVADLTPAILIECDESRYFYTTTTTTPTTTTTLTTTTSTTTSSTTTTPSSTTSTTIPLPSATTSHAQASNASLLTDTDATSSKIQLTSSMTSVPNGHTTNVTSTDKGFAIGVTAPDHKNDDDNEKSILSKPYVIAGLVVGSLALLGLTTCLIMAARRKLMNNKSKNSPPSDLWIPDKLDKDVEQMAPLRSDES